MDTLTIQIIGIAIAAYSAGLATYKPISEWYTSRTRKLEVVAKIPDNAYHVVDIKEREDFEDGGGVFYFEFVDPLEVKVKLIVTNISKRTIVLHSYGISTYNQDRNDFYDCKTWDTNKVLKPNESETIFIPISEILNNLKLAHSTDINSKYKLFVTDEKNKKYSCDFKFDYKYWYELSDKYRVLNDYYEKSPEKFSEGLSKTIHMMAEEIGRTGDLKNLKICQDSP